MPDKEKASCSVDQSKKQGYVEEISSQFDQESQGAGGEGSQDFDGAEDQASIPT
jgi:hypothetical protein